MDLDASSFLEAVAGYVQNPTTSAPVKSADRPTKIGTIDAAYASGLAKVTFDGESTMDAKPYAYLHSYYPVAGDRVLLEPVGTSYVIVGKIDTALPAQGNLDASWAAFTPTFTGLTLGNGVVSVRAKRIGKTVFVMGTLTMGSTTTYSGQFFMTIPFVAGGVWTSALPIGNAYLTDASAGTITPATVGPWTATTVAFRTATAVVTNLVPFTWAVSDVIGFSYSYETP
jgi:hypothetical protein